MISPAEMLQARILIVDDQDANVSLLEQTLRNAGYVSVTSTLDPRAVCELHRKNRYHLILLDLQMSGMDGFQVMTNLKEIEAEGYLPVIVLTALPGHKVRALKAGAKDFISKPFDLGEVLIRVHNMVEVRLLHLEVKRLFEQLGAKHALLEEQVNARKIADESTRENFERLRFMAESMPQKIFTAKCNGDIDYFNREWMEFTGLTFEQLKDWDWVQFIHPEDVEENSRRWRHSIESFDAFQLEHRVRRKDGVYRWHLSRAHAMRDTKGNVLMWIGSDTDVDDARSRLEEITRSGRAKDNFIAALSHELRTPLTPVLMMAAALRDDERLPVDVREQLGMIERNINLEARLIDDLLDLTKISHGKLPFRAELCDVHSLIEGAIEIVRDDASAKGISVERTFTARQSQLMVDPTRFQQVIWNLIRNAVKFTPAGGRVSIGTRDEKTRTGEKWLRIEVVDSGIGIESSKLEQIFMPFDQGGLMGDHRFGGVGLGLAIARAVVDLHGGRISAQSAGLNCGATFIVELPGVTESEAPFAAATTSVAALNLARLRLLVVDDHKSTLQAISTILQRDGHHVVAATTIAEALAAAAADKFDLLISDIGLPDGTGTELMKQLRAKYGLRGIALTGYGMEEDVAHTRNAGFATHLVKPVSGTELRRAITSLAPSQN